MYFRNLEISYWGIANLTNDDVSITHKLRRDVFWALSWKSKNKCNSCTTVLHYAIFTSAARHSLRLLPWPCCFILLLFLKAKSQKHWSEQLISLHFFLMFDKGSALIPCKNVAVVDIHVVYMNKFYYQTGTTLRTSNPLQNFNSTILSTVWCGP